MNTQLKEIINKLKIEFKEKEEKAKKLVVDEQAESVLVELLKFKEWLDEEIETLKAKIKEEAEAVMPNFKGLVGKELVFRVVKSREVFKTKDIGLVDEKFVRKISYLKLNDFEIKKYQKETGKLPENIVSETTPVKLEVKLKKDEETETEPYTD